MGSDPRFSASSAFIRGCVVPGQRSSSPPRPSASPHLTTSKCAIIPDSWCSRMWQWYIHSPGRSSGIHAIRTRPLGGTFTVSSPRAERRVADTGLDRRTRDLTVEAPGARHPTRSELPVDLAGFEIDLDDRAVGL